MHPACGLAGNHKDKKELASWGGGGCECAVDAAPVAGSSAARAACEHPSRAQVGRTDMGGLGGTWAPIGDILRISLTTQRGAGAICGTKDATGPSTNALFHFMPPRAAKSANELANKALLAARLAVVTAVAGSVAARMLARLIGRHASARGCPVHRHSRQR